MYVLSHSLISVLRYRYLRVLRGVGHHGLKSTVSTTLGAKITKIIIFDHMHSNDSLVL